MKPRPFILSLLLVIVAAPSLRAQWSGSLDFSTGLGGMMGNKELEVGMLGHVLTQGNVTVNYQTDKFTWKTQVGGRWEPRSSDKSRLNMRTNELGGLDLEVVYKTVKQRPLQVNVRSDFDWKPAAGRHYSSWIGYTFKNDLSRNVSNSLKGSMNVDGRQRQHYYENPRELVEELTLAEMESFEASCYYETPRLDEHSVASGVAGEWQLGERNQLQASGTISTTSSSKSTVWSVFKTTEYITKDDIDVNAAFLDGSASMYRITPRSIDLDFAADIHLKNTVRNDTISLNWTPGVRFSGNHSLDYNSGATLTDIGPSGDYVWRDSLRLRENFDYLCMNVAPFVALEYKGKHIEIAADYSLHFYLRRLNDETRKQALEMLPVSPSGSSRLVWKISDVHKLGITHAVGADYPNYLQICWYDRTGGYVDQLFRGNTELVSSLHSRYGFSYELHYKGFRYRTDNAVTRRINEIDQTWTNEEIEGRLYKVFHWINSADSWSFGTSHRLGWEGKWIKAGMGVNYNQSRRTAKSDGAIRNSSDWSLLLDLSARLGKGWSVGADARYQSSVATFFTRFDEYWVLNAHVKKEFERFNVFFDATDLLDHARQTTFESADGKELWVDVARENRRLFLLGVQWKF